MENIKKYQTELENTIIEMKNIIKGINSRPGDTEKCVSDLSWYNKVYVGIVKVRMNK